MTFLPSSSTTLVLILSVCALFVRAVSGCFLSWRALSVSWLLHRCCCATSLPCGSVMVPLSLLPWAWVLEQSLRVWSPSLCGISVTVLLPLMLHTCFVDGCVLPPFLPVMTLSFCCSRILVVEMRSCRCYCIVIIAYVIFVALVLHSCWSIAMCQCYHIVLIACVVVVALVLRCCYSVALVSLLLYPCCCMCLCRCIGLASLLICCCCVIIVCLSGVMIITCEWRMNLWLDVFMSV